MSAVPAVVVLAAGSGSRFDGPLHKLLQPFIGSTVLAATLRHAVATHFHVVVVTTEPLADVARRHVAARDVVVLPAVGSGAAEPLGMGYSIAAGVGASPNAPGWLMLPADMPMVKTATLVGVARALGPHPVVFAQHKGRRGHPVAFAAELYSELITLTGDEGARRLLRRYPAHGFECDDPGVLLDVDTEDDLDRMRQAQPAEHVERLAQASP